MLRPGILAALVLLLAPGPSPAHHNFASEFDAKRPFTLAGTVTKLEWTNPHAWFYLDVKDDASTVAKWAMEMGSPNNLMRDGWKRDSMKAGDVVNVPASLPRRPPASEGAATELDGLLNRTVGRRHAGDRDNGFQRPDVA